MISKIALRLAVLAFGATFASAPALAQSPSLSRPGFHAPSSQAPYGQASGLYNAVPGMVAPGSQGAAADCAARFRSYDPASGTYLGFDGRRHPCP
jgi:hypothetical protein